MMYITEAICFMTDTKALSLGDMQAYDCTLNRFHIIRRTSGTVRDGIPQSGFSHSIYWRP